MGTHRSFRLLCAITLVVAPATFGCASAPPAMSARTMTTSSSLLTGDEIRRNRIDNAYDAVRRLRPAYLRPRGPTSFSNAPQHDIIVIVNGQVYGGVEELRTLHAAEISWMRHLSASEAYVKTGRPSSSGAIELRVEPCRVGCP